MDSNIIYAVIFVIIALMITNRDKVWIVYTTIYYRFLTESCGVLSMISCYVHKKENQLKNYPDRKGYVAIVTGGGRGIGAHLVKELTKCGMHVVVAVRNPNKCDELNKLISEEKQPGTVEFMELDVSKLKSVKSFAEKVKTKHPEIHLLVNNAGIIYQDFSLTEDQFESHMATNYFGHFYLTHLLLDNLKLSGQNKKKFSRIVSVSSSAHYASCINFDDINWKVFYDQRGAYAQSKVAQLMMTSYLNDKFAKKNIPIRANSVHPGVVDTSMVDMYRDALGISWFMKIFLKSALEGATSIAVACFADEMEGKGGLYLSNGGEGWSSMYSRNKQQQKKLMVHTCKLLGIDKFGVYV